MQIWAGVGSADEGAAEAGLAHFHEHMLFKGTARRGVGEVAGEVEGAGGRINAFTSYDVTCYHATLPNDAWPVGLDVLSDAVLHSTFAAEEIALEIDVVLEEIRRSADSPASVLSELAARTIYLAHPYREPILGSAESVANFDRDKVRSFFERWYAPPNLALVAAGDFDPEEFLARAEQSFGGRRTTAANGSARRARVRRPEPAQRALRTAVLSRPFERVRMELAWPVVALRHPDAPALDLLAFILGSGDSSRLARRVRERDGLAERIDAACYTPLDPGAFSVDIETDGERAAIALSAAVREVERLRSESVSPEELDKAKTNFLAAQHFERESVSGQAGKLGGFLTLAGDPGLEERYLASVRDATPESLLRAARQYLGCDALSVAALVSLDARGALDDGIAADAVARGVAELERLREPPRRIGANGSGAAARAGRRAAPGRAAAPELFAYEIGGGARLYVVPRRAVPVVSLRAALLGGLLAETRERAGLSAFLAGMWMRGTRSHSAADFARASERMAIDLDSFSGRNSVGLTLDAPTERFDAGFELLSQVLLEPAFDPEEIERERRETLASIERREDSLAQRAFLLFGEAQFPTHPYGWPVLGWREGVLGFDAEAVALQHDALVRAGNLVICAAGDLDPDATAARVTARLAELDARPAVLPEPAIDAPPGEPRRLEARKDREQAHLVIGFRGLSLHDPDREVLEVISQILAGQGGRLFLELRDRQGLAYSVSASHADGLGTGTFSSYIGTSPEKLDAARAGLLGELEKLLAAPPELAELERARRYLVGNHRIDLQRNASHAAHVALDALYGIAPDAYHTLPERIAAVGPEDVLRVARRVIRLEARSEAVVRP